MKRHSAEEITAKLRQADELMTRGQSQAQACKALGVSVMTYHRWRKQQPPKGSEGLAPLGTTVQTIESIGPSASADQRRIDELRIENERLRRIVTDLLLEKVKIEEQIAFNLRGKAIARN
jgi:putative transposase